MLKKLTLAAMTIVSMSAFAQTMTTVDYQTSRPMYIAKGDMWDATGKSDMEVRKSIENRAVWALSGGDRYVLATMLDRLPSNVEHSLIWGLANAHKQAVLINDRMLAYRFPDSTTTVTTTTNTAGDTMVTTTTYTSPNWETTNLDWSGMDDSSRPMRFIMTRHSNPKDVDYLTALDIITSGNSESSAGVFASWWNNTATERQKDVVCRILKDDAGIADQVYYPSVFTHRTYSWINTTTNP